MTMDCGRAQELFSDELDGTLHDLLRSELRAHVASCGTCGPLADSFALVVTTLRQASIPVEAPAGLAERAAARALAAGRPKPRGAPLAMPRWLQVAAAALALATTAGVVRLVSGGSPGRMVVRTRDRVVAAGVQFLERKERLTEDLRIMRLVVATAFEERVDRVGDRVDDYRRLLEKRRAEDDKKVPAKTAPAEPSAEGPSLANPWTRAQVTRLSACAAPARAERKVDRA